MSAAPWLDDRLAANGATVRDNFARWFGKSLLVEATTGEARIFYHGTKADFDVFLPDEETTGYFFTEDPTYARYIADDDDVDNLRGQTIVPVYLRMCNPLDVTKGLKRKDKKRLLDQGAERDILEWIANPHSDQWMIFQVSEGGGFFERAARRAGFDGVIFNENVNSVACAVFSPTQIKSAIGNSGLFSEASASLTDGFDLIAMGLAQRARGVVCESSFRYRSGVTL